MRINRDRLCDTLQQRVSVLLAKAAAGDDVSAEQMKSVARFARLLDIYDATRPKSGRNWWAAGVLAGSLVLVTVLFFARVPATDIELDLVASEIRFGSEMRQLVTGTLALTDLGASGFREAVFPVGDAAGRETVVKPEGNPVAVRLSAIPDAKVPGQLTLAPLVLPANAVVALRAGESPHEFVMTLTSNGVDIHADAYGPVTLALPGAPSRRLELRIPRRVVLSHATNDADLALTFPRTPVTPFAPQLAISGLSMSRIDQFFGDADHALVRRVSTVVSGSLFLESLNGEEHKLRPGEELQFQESHGAIRQLRLEDNQIGLRYRGRVRGMITGSGEGLRSLMPTYLEWLRARHGASLLWGAALYVVGLIASALRWWGVRL